jgi:hypothetical protein
MPLPLLISVIFDKVTYPRRDIENIHQRVISLREAYNSSLTVMPELRSPYGYYFALGLMGAVGGGIGYFKRRNWI